MFKVRFVDGQPFVFDQNGQKVGDAHVTRIAFPRQPLLTSQGTVNVIAGTPTADIVVDGRYHSDIPVT